MRRAALLPLMTLLVAALPGCGSGPDEQARYDEYVALGDSFTSGAGLPRPVADGGQCQQSELSYPRLVAEELGARLHDASCGGATTEHATSAQPRAGADWPPQLDRLGADTDLVTVGLGYNDLGFFPGLLACTSVAVEDPSGAPCREQGGPPGHPDLASAPPAIEDRLQDLLEEVRRRAPSAELLVVGYPQLVPESGTCRELPLARGDYPFVREQLIALDDALRAGAEAAGIDFVDVLAASDRHDICAGDEAWVSGAAPQRGTAAPYHPFVRGQRAVAELVLAALPG